MSQLEKKDKYGYFRTENGIPIRKTDWVWGPRGLGTVLPAECEVASALSLFVGMRAGSEITRAVRIVLTEGKRRVIGS